MDEVSMNDGLDAPEAVAFGLGAAETAALVTALLTAYALTVSGLPAAPAWALAITVAGGGAVLCWGRHDDRSLLAWAVLLVRFTVRRQGTVMAALGAAAEAVRTCPEGVVAATRRRRRRPRTGDPRATGVRDGAGVGEGVGVSGDPGVIIRLVRAGGAEPAAARHRARRIVFFALRGGSGRTMLACELAALLAARGRLPDGTGRRRPRVVLLDLDDRLPAASLRLGIPLPTDSWDVATTAGPARRRLVRHGSDLLVLPGPGSPRPPGVLTAERVTAVVTEAEDEGADVVMFDITCDLSPACRHILDISDDIVVVVEASAAGLLDAYRSTVVLRRMGLRDRLVHVANRCGGSEDLGELEGDLGVVIRARVPDDPGLGADASLDGVASLDGGGAGATALSAFAAEVNRTLLARPADAAAEGETWGGRAG